MVSLKYGTDFCQQLSSVGLLSVNALFERRAVWTVIKSTRGVPKSISTVRNPNVMVVLSGPNSSERGQFQSFRVVAVVVVVVVEEFEIFIVIPATVRPLVLLMFF